MFEGGKIVVPDEGAPPFCLDEMQAQVFACRISDHE